MCSTCGCGEIEGVTVTLVGEESEFKRATGSLLTQPPSHHHHHPGKTIVDVERDILAKNNRSAEHNRQHFEADQIVAINLVSSPGSGKTSLLEATLQAMREEKVTVIEGDQQTTNDADRIARTGARVVQINTGKGCHLDADMVHHALHKLNPERGSFVFIENVGNLVCPAMFDLGEGYRVVIISVTEGDDKPLKYPDMFEGSDLCIINKIDLLPYVKFDLETCRQFARRANPSIEFLELSATSGQGLDSWINWLRERASQFAVT